MQACNVYSIIFTIWLHTIFCFLFEPYESSCYSSSIFLHLSLSLSLHLVFHFRFLHQCVGILYVMPTYYTIFQYFCKQHNVFIKKICIWTTMHVFGFRLSTSFPFFLGLSPVPKNVWLCNLARATSNHCFFFHLHFSLEIDTFKIGILCLNFDYFVCFMFCVCSP